MRKTSIYIGLAVVAVVAIVVAAVLTLRSDDHGHGGGTDAHSHIEPTDTDPTLADASTAARTAIEAIFTWQPATDRSSGAGLRRARPWLAGPLAAAADNPVERTLERPDPRWASWARHRDVVQAAATVTSTGPDTDTTATRYLRVMQTVLHIDGDRTPLDALEVVATCQRVDGRWALVNYHTV